MKRHKFILMPQTPERTWYKKSKQANQPALMLIMIVLDSMSVDT